MNSLNEISAADRGTLVSRWQTAFDREPPPRVHIGMLRRVLAWHIQAEAVGFKSVASRPGGASASRTAPLLRPGTRLLREWQGATHEVLVLPEGFEYTGQTYKSLSAIARAITGTPWSGPAFFGVKR